jgi:hypothetical protein
LYRAPVPRGCSLLDVMPEAPLPSGVGARPPDPELFRQSALI